MVNACRTAAAQNTTTPHRGSFIIVKVVKEMSLLQSAFSTKMNNLLKYYEAPLRSINESNNVKKARIILAFDLSFHIGAACWLFIVSYL